MAFDYTNYYILEYLQSSGAQYITTNINNNTIGRIVAEAKYNSASRQCLFGGWQSGSSIGYQLYVNSTSDVAIRATGPIDSETVIMGNFDTSKFYTFDIDYNNGYYKVDGTQKLTFSGYPTMDRALWIFCSNDSSDGAYLKASAILKYLEVYDRNGILINKFIPAERKSDNTLGLYDTVNETFSINSGTGSFTTSTDKGKLADGIYQIDNLESDGSAYINTGYKANDIYGFELDFERTQSVASNNNIFGYYVQTTDSFYQSLGNSTYAGGFYMSNNNRLVTNISDNVRTIVSWDYSDNKYYQDSTQIGSLAHNNNTTYDLYLLGRGGTENYGCYAKLYSAIIYDNSGNILAQYVPAKIESDHVLGLYEVVSESFLTNAGSGSFIDRSYDELPYIVTDGSAYIQTGVKGNQIYGFDIKFRAYETGSGNGQIIFGSYSSASSKFYFGFTNAQTSGMLASDSSSISNLGLSSNVDYTLSWKNGEHAYLGDVDIGAFSKTSLSTNITLFKRSDGYPCRCAIYYFRTYDSNLELSHNFVPVRRASDNSIGMYDTITDTFFANAGSGSFTTKLGEFDYNNYYRLEYIRATGTQYIITDYYANNNTRVVLKGNGYISAEQRLFGARTGNQSNSFYFMQNNPDSSDTSTKNKVRFAYANTNYHGSVVGDNLVGYPFEINADKNVWTLKYGNNQIMSNSFSSSTFTNTYPLGIFCVNTSTVELNGKYDLYSFIVYNDKVLIHKYLPAERKSDGEYGLYDTVTGKFLTNNGTGTFIAGSRISEGFDYSRYNEFDFLGTSSTGSYTSSYIDTLYVANPSTKVVINNFLPSYTGSAWEEYFGCNSANDGGNAFEFRRNNQTSKVLFRTGSSQTSGITVSGTENLDPGHNIILEYNGITVDGTKATIAGGSISKNTLYMFACHIDTGVFRQSYCRIGIVDIYENDVLVHKFVPCQRVSDGQNGYYDTIDGIFHSNEISGKFFGNAKPILNCSINDYDKVDYIESTGNQWIITDYYPDLNTRAFAGIYMTATAGSVIIGNSANHNDNDDYRFFNANNNAYLDIGSARSNGGSIANNTYYDIEFANFYVRAKGLTQTSTNSYTSSFTQMTLNIFAYSVPGNIASGRIYYLKIFESNNTLVRDMIPVKRKSDGLLGLYDLMTNTVYPNSGNGLFTYGSVRSDYYQLEDLQSSGTQYVNLNYASYEGIAMGAKASFPSVSSNTAIVFGVTSTNGRQYLGVRNDKLSFGVGSNERLIDYTFSANTDYTFYTSYAKGATLARVNGTDIYTGTDSSSYVANSYYAFAADNNNSATNISALKLYYLDLAASGLTVRHFVPAERLSDSAYGLYDTFTRQFFANSGTGTFTTSGRVEYELTVHSTSGGVTTGGGTYTKYLDKETLYTVTATPYLGFDFMGWYADPNYQTLMTDELTYTGIINQDTDIYALFKAQININISYDSTFGEASYTWISGTQISLTATPNEYGQFIGWYLGSSLLSTDNPYVYSPTEDIIFECRFDEVFDVTTSVSGDGAISYTRGSDKNDVTFTVIPNANRHFTKYAVNGTEYTTELLTIHITQAVTVIAYFEEDDRFHITANTNVGYNTIYISDNDVYAGTSVTLWARPYPNYNFIKWNDGSASNPRTITVNENVTLLAEFQKELDTNGIYQYRCYIKDQLYLTQRPKAFLRVDTFDIRTDLMTTANSVINILDTLTEDDRVSAMEELSNVNNGDILVLYDATGTTLYQGVIKSIEKNKITCSQMQSFYKGTWIYNIHASNSLEEEIAWLLGQYSQGKIYNSTYTDPLVAQRLGGITIDYTAATTVNLPTDLDEDGNENHTQYDMERWIYNLYETYGIIFDFEINFSGPNYVHIKVPSYSSLKVGNNMYAIRDMAPTTSIEEVNRLIIFARDGTYRTTYVATKNTIEEEPSTTMNRFDLTNTKIVYSDDTAADLVAAYIPEQMYNHRLNFTLLINNFIYEFGDFNLGGQLEVYYFNEYYDTVLSGYEITKQSNQNISEVKMICGKVRSKLTQKLTLGGVQ